MERRVRTKLDGKGQFGGKEVVPRICHTNPFAVPRNAGIPFSELALRRELGLGPKKEEEAPSPTPVNPAHPQPAAEAIGGGPAKAVLVAAVGAAAADGAVPVPMPGADKGLQDLWGKGEGWGKGKGWGKGQGKGKGKGKGRGKGMQVAAGGRGVAAKIAWAGKPGCWICQDLGHVAAQHRAWAANGWIPAAASSSSTQVAAKGGKKRPREAGPEEGVGAPAGQRFKSASGNTFNFYCC
jgi:hypothetical protein